jgi:hypothetical protein
MVPKLTHAKTVPTRMVAALSYSVGPIGAPTGQEDDIMQVLTPCEYAGSSSIGIRAKSKRTTGITISLNLHVVSRAAYFTLARSDTPCALVPAGGGLI